jgi:hypothetical protein
VSCQERERFCQRTAITSASSATAANSSVR